MTMTRQEMLLFRYGAATEKQRAAAEEVLTWAHERSAVVKALSADGMSQLEISSLLGLAQSSVWRLLHRGDAG